MWDLGNVFAIEGEGVGGHGLHGGLPALVGFGRGF